MIIVIVIVIVILLLLGGGGGYYVWDKRRKGEKISVCSCLTAQKKVNEGGWQPSMANRQFANPVYGSHGPGGQRQLAQQTMPLRMNTLDNSEI